MAKLPKFNTIPIKGLSEEEWSNYTIQKTAARHNLNYANTSSAKDKWKNSIDLDALSKQCKNMAKERRTAIRAYKVTTKRNGSKPSTITSKKFYKEYDSQVQAQDDLKLLQGGISNVLYGRALQYKGFIFEFI